MIDISRPVVFTSKMQSLISQKIADPKFTHKNWGDDDLLEIRKHIRDHYRKEQIGICAYCKKEVSLQSALNCHIEHIAPKSIYRDFIFEPKNLCVICADCNEIKREQEVMQDIPDTVKKGATRKKYPRSKAAFKIVQPHFVKYEDHIDVFNGFYVDRTPEGHFTIGACILNRRLRNFGWEKAYDDAAISEAMNKYLELKDPLERDRALRVIKKLLIAV